MEVILSSEKAVALECDLLVCGIFEDERPLKSTSGWLDWRLNGRLSRLVIDKKLTGEWKETTLIPSNGRVVPKLILLFGLGKIKDYGILRLRDLFPHVLETVKNLRTSSACLSLPYEEGRYNVELGKLTQIFLETVADGLRAWQNTADEEWIRSIRLYLAEGESRVSEILLGVQAVQSALQDRLPIRVFVPSSQPG